MSRHDEDRTAEPDSHTGRRATPLTRAVRYPNAYTWLVFLSALDIMMTWIVLSIDGHEVNALANRVITRWGLPGMVAYKFVLIVLVVAICEFIGCRDESTGRKLSRWAVWISALPIVVAFGWLLVESVRPSYW